MELKFRIIGEREKQATERQHERKRFVLLYHHGLLMGLRVYVCVGSGIYQPKLYLLSSSSAFLKLCVGAHLMGQDPISGGSLSASNESMRDGNIKCSKPLRLFKNQKVANFPAKS